MKMVLDSSVYVMMPARTAPALMLELVLTLTNVQMLEMPVPFIPSLLDRIFVYMILNTLAMIWLLPILTKTMLDQMLPVM